MDSDWKGSIYPRLPFFLQNAACGLEGRRQRRLRYGGVFQELLEWLEESQWWPASKIAAYQEEELAKLIQHAYSTVPYYRRVFDKLKLKPADIRSSDDLQKIPALTKEDVRYHAREMVSSEFPIKDLVFCHTSGTTGKSLQFYMEPRAFQFRWALWWRHKKRFAIDFDAPYATFTGLAAVPLAQDRPPFWRENRPMRQTIFTMHHIVPAKIRAIVDRLNEGGFQYYSGYPSILYALAGFIKEAGVEITAPPKIIFTGAENLYDYQRRMISEVFGCPVTDQYGFSEGCGNASRCNEDVFHEDFEYCILECAEPETVGVGTRRGRIVATGFGSYAMPFIRYDVGDSGQWLESSCSCGRLSQVLSRIDGRVEDYIITPEGRKIMRFDYVFKDSQNVHDAQVVQREPGGICLRVVRRPAYSSADEARLKKGINEMVSAGLQVEIEYVNEIEREPNGKVRAVKSYMRNGNQ